MIEKENINRIPKKPVNDIHGEKVLYQMVWRFTPKAAMLKSFKGVARLTVPPGETNLMHIHPAEEQIYIVVSGVGEVQVGEERAKAEPGDVFFLPANVPHGFFNTGKRPAVVINIGAAVPENP